MAEQKQETKITPPKQAAPTQPQVTPSAQGSGGGPPSTHPNVTIHTLTKGLAGAGSFSQF